MKTWLLLNRLALTAVCVLSGCAKLARWPGQVALFTGVGLRGEAAMLFGAVQLAAALALARDRSAKVGAMLALVTAILGSALLWMGGGGWGFAASLLVVASAVAAVVDPATERGERTARAAVSPEELLAGVDGELEVDTDALDLRVRIGRAEEER